MMKMAPIGFVGLGIMGKGMLHNLCTKLQGSTFVVWNRSPVVCEEMKAQFPEQITVADSAADVVRSCEVTYSMLSNMQASVSVFDEPDTGLIAGVSPGKIVVDCATLSPERMIQEEEAVSAKGGLFLEAPVSGSKVPAEQGTLIFLCGGNEEVYQKCAPAFDAMGKAKFFFGAVGKGSEVKIVVNMVMGTMMGALSEGLALGRENNLPLDALLQVLDLGALSNPMFRLKGPKMVAGEYEPNFPLKHAQKDMRLALDLAESNGISLPTTAAANQLMEKAMSEYEEAADEDFSATYRAL